MSAFAAGNPTTVSAANDIDLPWYVQPVANAQTQTWTQKPGSMQTGPVSVIVHINESPLAVVGRNWSHQQRVAQVAKIRAAQDRLVPQIEALGGKIRGRFAQASAGLGVDIDASKLQRLQSMSGVLAVRNVGDYRLDLTETPAWIGARAVTSLGVTGAGVDVAVIDSGVDYSHVKLGGPGTTAAYALAYCGDAALDPDPTDPDCDAHLSADTTGDFGDAEYGRDGSPTNKVVGGWDWVGEAWPTYGAASSDPNPIDFEGHGTHVSDIIGGLESSPGAGDAGVAPGVNLWGFKACSAVSSSCEGLAMLLSIDDALDLDDSDYGACTPDVDPYCLAYDPADVINMSLGSIYGQPEDDATLFANIASYYGSLVVASAGNSGDIPYIVGSPSAADAALSVAQSTVPSDKFYKITAGSVTASGLLQPWSPAPTGPLSGTLQYGDGAGGNLLGCAAFPPGSLEGKVLLVDRGTCNVSVKMSNGAAAGAEFVIVANNVFSNTPPSFSLGEGDSFAPTFSVTLNDGQRLKGVLGSTASVSPSNILPLQDDIVASSSRGPRVADGDIKPDIAAPGASVSAEVGTGNEKTAFGGTSGAAPMVSGSAALIVERFEDIELLDTAPGLDGPFGSLAPVVKSLLMNTANINTYIGGNSTVGGSGFLAPITLQGAGRVDVLKAFRTDTVAWDVTDFLGYLDNPDADPPCEATPVDDVLFFYLFGELPPCAADFPFGNDYFNAWNAQTGSLSFGYDGVSDRVSEKRVIAIANLGNATRAYNLSQSFRYADDRNRGVSVSFQPAALTVDPGATALVEVTLSVNANRLRDWTLDAGRYGNAGTNIYCSDPTYGTGCPTLSIFEYDGFVRIDGGGQNTVRLPWQVLPKKAAETYVQSVGNSQVKLRNPAKFKAGDTDVLALVDLSPNNCEIVNGDDECVEEDYVPGMLPGINATAIDLKEVGLRSYSVPGLNASLGLPAAPAGAINDEVLDFGATVFDAPYRASHNYPVEFDIYVDSNADGTDDYVAFNADIALAGDGRNAVFVADINPADGTRATVPYFYSFTDFNSQNWILPVPAQAVGVRSDRPFKFQTLAFDNYFTGDLWDCSPFDCNSYHTMQTGLLKYRPVVNELQVPTNGSYGLRYTRPNGGATASPSQIGLLFMYRDALVGRESQGVRLP